MIKLNISVCKTSFFHLRNLFRIRRYLTGDYASKVIHAFITPRIDYCYHLYYGLPKYQINKIQRILNTAAQFVTCKGRFEHATPLLVQLHWLLVVLCSSFYYCCTSLLVVLCSSLSMVSVHHMFLIYSRSSHHQDPYVLALWTILCNLCQRQRPMETERFLCAHLSCATV